VIRRAAAALAGAALVAGCGQQAGTRERSDDAGTALEATAIARGIVSDPAALNPVGAFASATDRVCVVPRDGEYSIGVSVDYGDRQHCVARGVARENGVLRVDFGGGCRLDARFDGERIVFPAEAPAACNQSCTGRASLSAVNTARLSVAEAEARAMRGADGNPLCS